MEKSKVAIYNTNDISISEIINEAMEQFPIDVKNKTVLIKPNMLGPFEQEKGVTTSPAVLQPLVEYLLSKKANVIVGDNPGGQGGGVEITAKRCGIFQASLGTFENIGKKCRIISINSRFVDKISVSDAVLDADIVIDLPRFKTHAYAGISGAIKNMFGIVVGPGKAQLHFAARKLEEFHELLVDLYQVRVPDLVIMDGISAMEGMGPTTGNLLPLNKILVSFDGVALDATVARMMGFNVELIKHITIAADRKLGKYKAEDIDVVGDASPIENFNLPVTYEEDDMIKAPRLSGVLELYKLGTAIPEFYDYKKCVKCGECAKSCPVGAINLTPYPTIDRKKCISCFCCAELCIRECFRYTDGREIFENLFSKL